MPALVKCTLDNMRIEDVAAHLGKSPTANGVNRDALATGVKPGIRAGLLSLVFHRSLELPKCFSGDLAMPNRRQPSRIAEAIVERSAGSESLAARVSDTFEFLCLSDGGAERSLAECHFRLTTGALG